MSPFHNHPSFFNQPILLSKEHTKDPATFLDRFFGDYNLSELRAWLADISETCLTTDTPPFDEAGKRADLILFFKNVEHLFETALILKMGNISKSNE
jgi:hypothetical protein